MGRYKNWNYREAALEFVIANVPIHHAKFFEQHSFAALAWLVENQYVKIDKDLILRFGEDDDED